MIHLLCMHFRDDAREEQIAEFIDSLDRPFEWRTIPQASEAKRLLTITCDSAEEAALLMTKIPDRRIMTAFAFSTPVSEVADV